MRKLLISILLASAAATPALADPGDRSDRSDRQSAHVERQQAHESRGDRSERSERAVQVERPQFSGQGQGQGQGRFNGPMSGGQQQSFVRPEHFQQNVQPNPEGNERAVQALRAEGNGGERSRGPRIINNNTGDSVRNWRGVERRQMVQQRDDVVEQGEVRTRGPHMIVNDTLREPDRPLPNVMRTHTRTPVVSDVPRPGTQPPLRTERRHTGYVGWNTDWRNDRRHDWRDWRRHHHSWFHLGYYYDPFGWGYSPFSIGWRMWPSYYSNSFWINDPWQYRLPYAPPGTRWVRYYNDAILVDTWTGEVLDVVYDFFW
jgi:hypothetical protein